MLQTPSRYRVLLLNDNAWQLIVRIVGHGRLCILVSAAANDHVSLRTQETAIAELDVLLGWSACPQLVILSKVAFDFRRFIVQRI